MKRLIAAALLCLATAAGAVLPDEQLADPVLEARAREISKELRCVVCQNQSIDDSDATLAHDLRVIVREQLVAGKSNEEVKSYLVDRYGHYVLLRPPFNAETWLLWLGPLLVLALGGLGVALYFRGRRSASNAAPELTPAEAARLNALLHDPEKP